MPHSSDRRAATFPLQTFNCIDPSQTKYASQPVQICEPRQLRRAAHRLGALAWLGAAIYSSAVSSQRPAILHAAEDGGRRRRRGCSLPIQRLRLPSTLSQVPPPFTAEVLRPCNHPLDCGHRPWRDITMPSARAVKGTQRMVLRSLEGAWEPYTAARCWPTLSLNASAASVVATNIWR